MAEQVLTNAKLFIGQYDYSGVSNKVALRVSHPALDKTVFSSYSARQIAAGLREMRFSGEGLANYGNLLQDETLFGKIGGDEPFILGQTTGLDGEPCFLGRLAALDYQTMDAEVGALVPFTIDGESAGSRVQRGTIMHDAATARTISGNGVARQLGNATGKRVYASLHVISVSGTSPSLTVKIQSDNAVGMASPVDVITFGAKTAIASEFQDIAGSSTDDFWRVNYTISGTTPSFTFVVAVAVA